MQDFDLWREPYCRIGNRTHRRLSASPARTLRETTRGAAAQNGANRRTLGTGDNAAPAVTYWKQQAIGCDWSDPRGGARGHRQRRDSGDTSEALQVYETALDQFPTLVDNYVFMTRKLWAETHQPDSYQRYLRERAMGRKIRSIGEESQQ